ncbi:MAG TPA: type 1 glutamine amidotransferase [Solirubrobacteraceae bacterium]|nr:type 1 glutamine amidotransferase [Solirubrobacteraceae bacterium]
MRVLGVRHPGGGTCGLLAERCEAGGHELTEWIPGAGEPLPAPPTEFDAIAVFGGGMNVRDTDRLPWMRAEVELLRDALQLEVPVLGVCLGAQLLATAAGAEIRRSPSPEIGWFDVARCFEGERDPIFAGLPARFLAYEWHSYAFALPAGSVELARSAACPQAFRLGETAWGVQFHPEVVPEIVREWALDYESDPDAIAMGFDPPAHIAEAAERLPAWMDIGRDLFEGFLTAASAARPAPLAAAARSAQDPPPPRG